MSALKLSHRVIILSDVLSQEVAGETVLLDLTSEKYFGLDPVGTRIWQLLKEDRPLSEVIAVLLAEYDIGADQLQSDLFSLLEKLREKGLIQLESP
jgi:hypothetical protein